MPRPIRKIVIPVTIFNHETGYEINLYNDTVTVQSPWVQVLPSGVALVRSSASIIRQVGVGNRYREKESQVIVNLVADHLDDKYLLHLQRD